MDNKDNNSVYAFVVDQNGFISHSVIIDDLENIPENTVIEMFPTNLVLIKPKWNGSTWIEGETEEEKAERESQQLLESLKPTPVEIADAELEIKMITMLSDLGVVQ